MFGFAPRQSGEWEELLHNRGKEGNLSTECEVLKKPSRKHTPSTVQNGTMQDQVTMRIPIPREVPSALEKQICHGAP